MIILGIETSCDESGLALVEGGTRVIADVVASQIAKHQPYGGIVPEVAAREHVTNLPVLLRQLYERAGWSAADVPDVIAVTDGPGLLSSLNVGISWAYGLGLGWKKPVIGVNHLAAHLYAASGPAFPFPHLGMLVSGGHTLLVLRRDMFTAEVIGETIDDAAGEAYDKVARLLGLGYPGGPEIDRLSAAGAADRVALPRPRIKGKPLHFSFSGLKTAVLYAQRRQDAAEAPASAWSVADMCASFQTAVLDVLFARVRKAGEQYDCRRLCCGGGVAANAGLRARAEQLRGHGWDISLPPLAQCVDNGVMVAGYGYQLWQAGHRRAPAGNPNLKLGNK